MTRKAGQLISRGPHTWLVRVSLGRDPESLPLFIPKLSECSQELVNRIEPFDNLVAAMVFRVGA